MASVNPIPDALGESDREKTKSGSKLDQLLAQADNAFQANLPGKAAAFYDEAVRIDPQNVHAHHRLAIIADMQKNYQLAESHYTSALKVEPNNLNLLNDLGYSYYLQKKFEEAHAYLSYVLQMDPSNSLAMKNLGLVHAARGETQKAYALLQQGGLDAGESQKKIREALTLASSGSQSTESPGTASLSQTQASPSYTIQPAGGQSGRTTQPANANYSRPQQNPQTNTTQNTSASQPKFQSSPWDDQLSSPRAPTPTRVEKYASPAEPGFSNVGTAPQQPTAYADPDYQLERAALNTGFGSLFPMTSSEEYHRARRARPVSWENQSGSPPQADHAHHQQFGNVNSNQISVQNAHHTQQQLGSSQSVSHAQPKSLAETGRQPSQQPNEQLRYAVPVTQPQFQPQSPTGSYDRFPQPSERTQTAPATRTPNSYDSSPTTYNPFSPQSTTDRSPVQPPPANALREYQQGLRNQSPRFDGSQFR